MGAIYPRGSRRQRTLRRASHCVGDTGTGHRQFGCIPALFAYATFFRGMVDHPGFDWSSNPSFQGTRLQHVATITHEADPELRRKKQEQYAKEIRDEFNALTKEGS